MENIWREWYAWFPVKPLDEQGPFWLEVVWRRRDKITGVWAYKSFRSDDQKNAESAFREL